MNDDAPIELIGFHPETHVILARRSGEPSFVWVQDLEDAYQAAGSRGGVDVITSAQFRGELLAAGVPPLAAVVARLHHAADAGHASGRAIAATARAA